MRVNSLMKHSESAMDLKTQPQAPHQYHRYIDMEGKHEVEFNLKHRGFQCTILYDLPLEQTMYAENRTVFKNRKLHEIQEMVMGCEILSHQVLGLFKMEVSDSDDQVHTKDCCMHEELSGRTIRKYYFFNPN